MTNDPGYRPGRVFKGVEAGNWCHATSLRDVRHLPDVRWCSLCHGPGNRHLQMMLPVPRALTMSRLSITKAGSLNDALGAERSMGQGSWRYRDICTKEGENKIISIITFRNEVAKVMFLHLSFSHSVHRGGGGRVCLSACWNPNSPGTTASESGTPRGYKLKGTCSYGDRVFDFSQKVKRPSLYWPLMRMVSISKSADS